MNGLAQLRWSLHSFSLVGVDQIVVSSLVRKLNSDKTIYNNIVPTFLYGFITFCIMKACSSTSWWKFNEKNGSVKQKVNLQRLPPSRVQEMKRGRVNAAAPRQEARATAVEAFDVRVLINEDYGLCECVSPDLSTSTRRRRHGQKTCWKHAEKHSSSFERRGFWTISSAFI